MAITTDRTEQGTTVELGVEDVDEFGKRVDALAARMDPGRRRIADPATGEVLGAAVSAEDLYAAYAEVESARATVRGLQNDLKEAREEQRDAEGRLRDVYEQLRDQRAAGRGR